MQHIVKITAFKSFIISEVEKAKSNLELANSYKNDSLLFYAILCDEANALIEGLPIKEARILMKELQNLADEGLKTLFSSLEIVT